MPSRLLLAANRPGYFAGRNPVAAVDDHPNGHDPLIEPEVGALENGPGRKRELLAAAFFSTLVALTALDLADVDRSTLRAAGTIGPLDPFDVAFGGVGVEVTDGSKQGVRILLERDHGQSLPQCGGKRYNGLARVPWRFTRLGICPSVLSAPAGFEAGNGPFGSPQAI